MDPSVLAAATGGVFDGGGRGAGWEFSVPGRVSVVCPTTDDRVLFHGQLYGCFLAQTWPDKELVVVDTGSSPSPFLANIALRDRRLVYRHYPCLAGAWPVGLKRNLAVFLASGDAIVHFDDDDLYAPGYVEHMMAALGGADAATLSRWFVCDPLAGVVGQVRPAEDGSQDDWILGYGFSHVYLRDACLARPFPHEHFGEDYRFLAALRAAPGGRGVRAVPDDAGLALHVQQGMNLSTSHAAAQVPAARAARLAVAALPAFAALLPGLEPASPVRSRLDDGPRPSPFVSFGDAVHMYLRPSPHVEAAEMLRLLHAVGVAAAPALVLPPAAEGPPGGARPAASLSARVDCPEGGCWTEADRLFGDEVRFAEGARLPADVPRGAPAGCVALLHAARQLLARSTASADAAEVGDARLVGWVRVESRRLTHLAFPSLAQRFLRQFPRVRLEVAFDANQEPPRDAAGPQRELLRRLLAEPGPARC